MTKKEISHFCIAKIKSGIKHAVSVYSKKVNQRMKVIRHIPDALGKIVHGLMSEWKIYQVIAKIDGKHRGAAERT